MANSIGVCPPGLPLSEQDLAFTPLMASVSQNHRIIKWFGSEGIIRIQPSATGRDTSHSIRLFKAPSSLAFSTARTGIHSCSGQALPVSHHPHRKEHLLTSDWNLPSLRLKPSPLVLSLRFLIKSPSPSFPWAPFKSSSLHWAASDSRQVVVYSRAAACSPGILTDVGIIIDG